MVHRVKVRQPRLSPDTSNPLGGNSFFAFKPTVLRQLTAFGYWPGNVWIAKRVCLY